MQRITPALMFNGGAKAAVDFYLSVFPNSKLKSEELWPDGSHLASTFELNGVEFLAISGGPECVHTMASSYMVNCDTQEEIDHLWDTLSDGGVTHACGWLTDKFGVVWQIQPSWFGEKMKSGTPAQTKAMFDALMQMVKVDMAELQRAFESA
ncbi:MAG: VOC family protein [Fimbriimonadaceae bacterium]